MTQRSKPQAQPPPDPAILELARVIARQAAREEFARRQSMTGPPHSQAPELVPASRP